MTIEDAISFFRLRLGSFEDDSKYSDRFLYDTLKNAAAIVFSRLESSGKPIPKTFWSTYYVILKKVKDNECLPEHLQCDVFETPFDIPDFFNGRKTRYFRVIYNGKDLPYYDPSLREHFLFKNTPMWEIYNGKLRIYSSYPVYGVYVKGIFTDNAAWFDKMCSVSSGNDDNGENGENGENGDSPGGDILAPCDVMTMKFPLLSDSSYKDMIFKVAEESLIFDLKLPDKSVSDENSPS